MASFVALPRGINAGLGRTVRMDKLRRAFEVIGFARQGAPEAFTVRSVKSVRTIAREFEA